MSAEHLKLSVAASLVAFLLLAAPGAASIAGETAPAGSAGEPALPAMLRLALTRSQAADVATAYHFDREGHGTNPRHGLELAFTPRGARIAGPEGGFALRLERFGRGDGRPVRHAAPRIDGAWVEYDRGAGLSEWFVNLPLGVEQGWTVSERPDGHGPLVLELDTARPPDEDGYRRLAWSGLVYHRLLALDAEGRELSAVWAHDGDRLRIEVDDRDAAYPLLIDPWVEQAKLTADEGGAQDNFGWSVALEGDVALVGAPFAGTPRHGAAYIFTRSGDLWSQQTELVADDGAEWDFFGGSVALRGDTALVGAPGNIFFKPSPGPGSVYVFKRTGDVWSQQEKLAAQDGEEGDSFGVAVALGVDTALVGAQRAGDWQGAAYVFTRSGGEWDQQTKLTADDGLPDDGLGGSVALAGDTALLGASAAVVGGNFSQGAAYVFTRSGEVWSQQDKLIASDGEPGDVFGRAVALTGDSALVGAPGAAVGGDADHGAAYFFTRSGGEWSEQDRLSADDGEMGDGFGGAVALTGDMALVGASTASPESNSNQGLAYVFARSGNLWSQRARLSAADGESTDFFGSSVALAGGTALVGANLASVDGTFDQGAAYVFVPPVAPVALAVDPQSTASADGNSVFEPGETVVVAPAWHNNGTAPLGLIGGASNFTGPPGATYDVAQAGAVYGTLAPGQSASCLDTGTCYFLGVNDPARPAAHWDATFDETLDDTDNTARTWTLHLGDSFADVPRNSLFYTWIETLLHSGVTGGCTQTGYCPAATSTRGQMPVFVLRALLGPAFTPEPCVGGQEQFDDVPADHLFCSWIEELAERGVVAGCGNGNYCPDSPVTRAQMAIFLLRTLEGADYTPSECKGVFADVDCPSIFADWIEELFNRGVTGGCNEAPLRYCPTAANTRSQMAVFLSKTFGLALYGP